jgi:hypothetical protein
MVIQASALSTSIAGVPDDSPVSMLPERPDIAILRDALANHWSRDPAKQQVHIDGLLHIATYHPKAKARIEATRALAYIDSVNQRREAKLLDILCDRGRDPLPNPAPVVPQANQTVIGQVNVIAAGDQPASDPMSGLMRLIQSGLPCPSTQPLTPDQPSAPITALHEKPEGGQRGLVPTAEDGAAPEGQADTPTPAERPEMPDESTSLLDRIKRNGNGHKPE